MRLCDTFHAPERRQLLLHARGHAVRRLVLHRCPAANLGGGAKCWEVLQDV
jgi:hypothetical protein